METLHLFQQKAHLCDITLVACDGKKVVAHAGVLAASSSLLRKELEECKLGTYTIITPFTRREILTVIRFAYTGKKVVTLRHHFFKEMAFLQSEDEITHMKTVVEFLNEFAAKGLFCNTACCQRNGETEPTQSYVLAARYPLLSQGIPNLSMVIAHTGKVVGDSSRVEVKSETTNQYESTNKKSQTNFSFVCDVCNRAFFDMPIFSGKEYVHTQPERNMCYICYKREKPNLPAHKLLASIINRNCFVCPLCDIQFNTASLMHER